ncbi:MAG: hypothetical protein RLZZ135_635, partial [Cyanobacteriota bacterium]
SAVDIRQTPTIPQIASFLFCVVSKFNNIDQYKLFTSY